MTERRKRLIEVAFPLEEVSEHSRREKNVRHGHISTLHIWWARRPLAACRAFIYASLVDDPPTETEREELLREVADLASWDAVRKPDTVVRQRDKGGSGLTGHVLLQRARERILRGNGGKAPRLLDPFAGGGAIPLEALRLGCEVEASDLNPVAVLILKGTVEYPQKYGRPLAEQGAKRPDDCAGVNGQVPNYIREAAKGLQGSFGESDAVAAYEKNPLAADVRYWGNWMLEKARKELAQFYPPDPDGSVPVAYLWSRTVPCPNCAGEMPLIRQYWLARKSSKKIALKPVIDRDAKRVDFEVVTGEGVTDDPGDATTSRGDSVCLLCRQVVKAEYVRQAGRDGKLAARITAVVMEAQGRSGKTYRSPTLHDYRAFALAEERLRELNDAYTDGGLLQLPDEPIHPDTLGLRVDQFGLTTWRSLFNNRQLLAMSTFSGLVSMSRAEMSEKGLAKDYAEAVGAYLALCVGRLADYLTTLTVWANTGEFTAHTFGRQTLNMVWDYSEVCLLQDTSGAFPGAIEWVSLVIENESFATASPASVVLRSATVQAGQRDVIITDPPYYNAIDYAGLSDFFYVWLKRSLPNGSLASLFAQPLTPKREQAIMASESNSETARARYVDLTQRALTASRAGLGTDGMLSIVFAHSDSDAWATLIECLLRADLSPDASWPIDTEREAKISSEKRANLATSVWMSCRPREVNAGPAFLGDLHDELRREIESKLLDFWRRGIRGADFFISAIGPALSVYGRHSKVLRPDGSEVTVRDFLDIVRRESTRVALQQVLGGESLGVIDPATQAYVTWAWSYGKAPLDAGEAIALCLATGADLDDLTRPHAVAEMVKEKSKKVVKLRGIAARAREDDELGHGNGARVTPLIDQLQHAAWLWGANRAADLAKYRAELGEPRWKALRVLGQAVAECLPEGDDDRRLVNGMLGSSVTAGTAAPVVAGQQQRLDLQES
jgi:adenine-specific DNA methylase